MTQPKAGRRGALDRVGPSESQAIAVARDRLERPHRDAHETSARRARMPKELGGLLRWFAAEWDSEVPERLHTVEVWHGRQEYRQVPVTDADGQQKLDADGQPVKRVETVWPDGPDGLVGGSGLGSHGLTDRFRRYMESYAGERDEDGYYVRPMHAALARLARRDHWMARNLFAVAQSGYDWQGVADRGHWVHGMYRVYIEEALRRLWLEYAEQGLRLQ